MALYWLVPAISILTASQPGAQEIAIETEVGYRGLFQLGQPFPLRVNLTNLGRPLTGAVEIKTWKGGPSMGTPAYPVLYKREVFLSSGSRKSLRFTVDADSVGRPLSVTFSDSGTTGSREIDLRDHFSSAPLVLLVTESGQAGSIPAPAGLSNPFLSVPLSDLPDDARGYLGVSAIVLYEQSLRELSKRQAAAIDFWLFQGGTLLIAGSIHYALYQEPAMLHFLPVRVTGLRDLPSASALEKSYGASLSGGRILVQDSTPVGGKVVFEEKGTPLLVQRSLGKGRTFYLSLDVGRPPISRWAGLPRLLTDLLTPPAGVREKVPDTDWSESILSELLAPSFTVFSTSVVVVLLIVLAYAGGLAVLAYGWKKEKLGQPALGGGFLCLVLGASVMGYLYFDRASGAPDGLFLSSTVLDGSDDGYVQVESNGGLFSTRARRFALELESGWLAMDLLNPAAWGSESPPTMMEGRGGFEELKFSMKEWEQRLFRVRSVALFPVSIEVQRKGDLLSLRVKNGSAGALTDCWLVTGEGGLSLGDFPAGSNGQTRTFQISSLYPRKTRTSHKDLAFVDKVRTILLHRSIFPEHGGRRGFDDRSLLFFGWVEGGMKGLRTNDSRVLAVNHTLFRQTVLIPNVS